MAIDSASAQAATRSSRRHGYSARTARRAPEPFVVPEPLRAVERREHRADGADAVAADQVDLDARFVERAQHAGMIGAGRAGAGQQERGAEFRGVRVGERGMQIGRRRRRARRPGARKADRSFLRDVVNGDELHDLELARPSRRHDLHGITRLPVQKRMSDRRGRGDQPFGRIRILGHDQRVDQRLAVLFDHVTWEPNPARSLGMRSMLISAISPTRFCSMLIRDSTSRWRSFAAGYSAFSRRSPSSRARLISFGSSSFSSRSSAAISSSNFLIRRSSSSPA